MSDAIGILADQVSRIDSKLDRILEAQATNGERLTDVESRTEQAVGDMERLNATVEELLAVDPDARDIGALVGLAKRHPKWAVLTMAALYFGTAALVGSYTARVSLPDEVRGALEAAEALASDDIDPAVNIPEDMLYAD
jgi:hypothetical protein